MKAKPCVIDLTVDCLCGQRQEREGTAIRLLLEEEKLAEPAHPYTCVTLPIFPIISKCLGTFSSTSPSGLLLIG